MMATVAAAVTAAGCRCYCQPVSALENTVMVAADPVVPTMLRAPSLLRARWAGGSGESKQWRDDSGTTYGAYHLAVD